MNIDQKSKKIIITDVDGVITSWQSGLPFFLHERGLSTIPAIGNILDEIYLKPSELFRDARGKSVSECAAMDLFEEYNSSDYIRTLPAYNDALDVINQMRHRYRFIAVSALCDTAKAYSNRLKNLDCLFPNAFDSLHLSGAGKTKVHIFCNLISDIGKEDIVCYIDDRVDHLDQFDKAYKNIIGEDAPLLFQMNRRSQPKHTSPNTVPVNNWYQIEGKLCRM
jgi:FMN phosphatase YigB (HAD superfamily)